MPLWWANQFSLKSKKLHTHKKKKKNGDSIVHNYTLTKKNAEEKTYLPTGLIHRMDKYNK